MSKQKWTRKQMVNACLKGGMGTHFTGCPRTAKSYSNLETRSGYCFFFAFVFCFVIVQQEFVDVFSAYVVMPVLSLSLVVDSSRFSFLEVWLLPSSVRFAVFIILFLSLSPSQPASCFSLRTMSFRSKLLVLWLWFSGAGRARKQWFASDWRLKQLIEFPV